MRVLLVQGHPRPDSFGAALAPAVRDAPEGAGHAVEFRDLYAEEFAPP